VRVIGLLASERHPSTNCVRRCWNVASQFPRVVGKLEQHLEAIRISDSDHSLNPRIRQLIDDMRAEWLELDRRIAAFDNEFAAYARSDADARRLATIPGIGVLNATALLAAIGDGQTFARGCDLAAWLGLVPRQITTGGKPHLVGITKLARDFLIPSWSIAEYPVGVARKSGAKAGAGSVRTSVHMTAHTTISAWTSTVPTLRD
jgi:transposase